MTVIAFLPQVDRIDQRLWFQWDKANHFGAYFAVVLIARLSFPSWPYYGVFAVLMAQGIMVEWIQPYFGRTASFGDLLANGLGIITGLCANLVWRYCHKVRANSKASDRP